MGVCICMCIYLWHTYACEYTMPAKSICIHKHHAFTEEICTCTCRWVDIQNICISMYMMYLGNCTRAPDF